MTSEVKLEPTAEDGGAVEAGLNLERLANSGHTPGPWQWATSHDYGYSALWNPDTRAEVISTSGRNDSDHPITWMGEEMSEADAELISSAVGLLDLATQQAAEITRLRAENAVMRAEVMALVPFAYGSVDVSHPEAVNQVAECWFSATSDDLTLPWMKQPPRVRTHMRKTVREVLNAAAMVTARARARAAIAKASQAEGQTR